MQTLHDLMTEIAELKPVAARMLILFCMIYFFMLSMDGCRVVVHSALVKSGLAPAGCMHSCKYHKPVCADSTGEHK